MRRGLPSFKAYLQFLSPQQQVSEINWLIDNLLKEKKSFIDINKKCNIIKELKNIRHRILLNR